MKTTLDLPDDLVKEIKLRAIHEGSKLKDAVASLLRKGLAAKSAGTQKGATDVTADKSALARRQEMTEKFLSGEWGVELAGYEEAKESDRRSAAVRSKAWRK